MAFKSLTDYGKSLAKNFFRLNYDGESAEVIILYNSVNEVLVGDVHYVKSADYSGYVHCLGKGCPACAKGIRVQTRLFIPVYNIGAGEIQFFDRSARFGMDLNDQVFSKYPNPSEYIFKITRHGEVRSLDTTYTFEAIAHNNTSYAQVLASKGVKFPDFYESVCRSVPEAELREMVNPALASSTNSRSGYATLPNYTITPRTSTVSIPEDATIPDAPPSLGISEVKTNCIANDEIPF